MIKKSWLQVFLVLLVTFFAYGNILNNQFVWDDYEFIVQWEAPRNFSNFGEFLKGATPPNHEGIYRPVRTIFYALTINGFGAENPLPYHIQGLLVHSLITALIFFITKKITQNKYIPFLTALFFGIHPVHTENVSFATANFDLYGVLFMFAAYWLYLLSERGRRKLILLSSVVLAALALFTYELTLPLVVILIVTDYFFAEKRPSRIKDYLVYMWYLLPTISYFLIRFVVLKIPTRTGFLLDSFYYTLLTMSKTFWRYLTVLVFPLQLNVIPTIAPGITALKVEENAVRAQKFFEIQTIATILIIFVLIACIFALRKKLPLISFSLIWIALFMLPFLNIIPVGVLYSERYLYIVSYGFCLLIAYFIAHFFESKPKTRIIIATIAILYASFLFIRTVTRNNDWNDSFALWKNTISQSPDNPDMWNNLGIAYSQSLRDELAVESFKKAIELNPYDARYYLNAAINYQRLGNLSEARFLRERAYEIAPEDKKYAIALADTYIDLSRNRDAISILEKSILKKKDPDVYQKLAKAYVELKNMQKAKEILLVSLELFPDHFETYNNLATVYMRLGELDLAEDALKSAFKIKKDSPQAYYNLAALYLLRQDVDKSRELLRKTLEIQPDFIEAQTLLQKLERE